MGTRTRFWCVSHCRARIPRRACVDAQTHQGLRCLHAQSMDVDEVSDQNFKRGIREIAIST